MKYQKTVLVVGCVLGFVSGILWFRIGEILDGYTNNFIAWFIMPAIPPLLIIGVCLLRYYSRKTLIIDFTFIALYYAFHWLPIILVLLYFILFNVKM